MRKTITLEGMGMALRVAINGCGRIGRMLAKVLLSRSDVKLVGLIGTEQADVVASRLQHDPVYGDYEAHVAGEGSVITINGRHIPYLKDLRSFKDADTGAEILVETTGEIFSHRDTLAMLKESGAKRLLIAGDVDDKAIPRVITGVNEQEIEPEPVISNGSAMSQAVALLRGVLEETSLIGAMTATVFSDSMLRRYVSLSDVRAYREQFDTVIPTSAKNDPVTTFSVPTSSVSLVEVVGVAKSHVTKTALKTALEKVAREPYFQGLIGLSTEPLVSTDFRGNPNSVVIDETLSTVVDGTLVKLFGWFDAEWAYGNRLAEIVVDMGKKKE